MSIPIRRCGCLVSLTLASLVASGCASTSSVQWDRRPATPGTRPPERVFVLAPSVVGTAGAGNVGRDFAKIDAAVLDRILTIVKERSPGAEVASPGPAVAMGVLPGYARALAGVPSSREEFDAARLAREHGATHLLVPVITQWTEMRSGDPIGAVIVPHNRIAVTLRLMRLQPPEVAGIVTFTNHSRLTLNQGAARLLDDHFQQIVLRLLASG